MKLLNAPGWICFLLLGCSEPQSQSQPQSQPQEAAAQSKVLPQVQPQSEGRSSDTTVSNFKRVILPRGVSINLPKSWWVLDDDITTIIHTSAEAALDISGMKVAEEGEVDLIRANSLPRSTYATLALTTLPSTADTFREAAALTKADIGEFERQLKNEILPKTMSAIGQSLLDFYGCYLDKIDGKPAIITEYRRTGQNGPVLVQISRIFSETQEVSLNLSYRESEGIIWKPVLSKMRHSISIN